MKREIKFRGQKWDADLNRLGFVYGYLTDRNVIEDKLGNSHVVWEDSIGQFTGLKDKNGVDIYEGDYIGMYGSKDKIEYWEYSEDGRLIKVNKYGNFTIDALLIHDKKLLEVIGNIHENK